ncbi:glycosyltransferase [Corynebacterium freiburgense]|uniref:glycosyltransferase n=1 Tax=Corynebacterium freiburgense TaxID=556548 RepID=UPI00040E8978|nr:glycosyltransferase [Corynebacterium freiburgense]WJZ03795.1 Glycosyl transferase family 2 [Corynebacterium freiburgense]
MDAIDVVVCTVTGREHFLDACVEAIKKELQEDDTLTIIRDRPLADARNEGVSQGSNPIIVFIDDDAIPRPGWRASMSVFEDPEIVGIGGAVHPRFEAGEGDERHAWVYGCDHAGLPADGEEIRNPIGAAMAFRRPIPLFSPALGRVGGNTSGGEETELCQRIDGKIIRHTAFAVDHFVPESRTKLAYHMKRSFDEGRIKSWLNDLGSEREYARHPSLHVAAAALGFALGKRGFIPPKTPTREASIIVCTDGRRPLDLHHIEKSMEGIDAELILVDNSADGIGMGIRAPQPGLARARNVGIRAANGKILAFTDDDARPDPNWLRELINSYDDETWAVTGRVVSKPETEAQELFENHVSFDMGEKPRRWSLDTEEAPPLYPYPAGSFGAGVNMSFRAEVFQKIGGFAEELGTGRCTRGGEDLDMLRRVVLHGGVIQYQPKAIVCHIHRHSKRALAKQMFGFGTGFTASLARCLADGKFVPTTIRGKVPHGAVKPPTEPSPWWMRTAEIAGYLCGPPLFMAARLSDAVDTWKKTE